MNNTTRLSLVRDVLHMLSNDETIGMARDIADELIVTANESNRSLDELTLGEMRAEIAAYRATRALLAS
jgi:hypothetical protein